MGSARDDRLSMGLGTIKRPEGSTFPGDYNPTTEQRATAAELLESWNPRDDETGQPLGVGDIDILIDYLATLCAKDDVALAQKSALHYMDLTGWYRILAVLHT